MGVAVLQTRQDSPTGEIHFARRRCGKLSNVSVGTDGDEAVAANRDRLDFRAIRPHRHDMLDPDPQKRADNLKYVTDRLALADAVQARCCVDIAGSYNPSVWYGADPKNLSPEFFDATVENCRKVIDAVKPRTTKFSIEMMGWSLPDGPDSYLKLIRAVDRSAFAVHMDVCNGINSPTRFYQNREFIAECFTKLGKWIVSCHAKDLAWVPEYNVHFKEVVPGKGQLDYAEYLRQLSRLGVDAPLMLEHLQTPEEYTEGRDYIKSVGSRIGVGFA